MSVADDRFVIPHHPNIDWTKPMPANSADSADSAETATAPTGPTEDPRS